MKKTILSASVAALLAASAMSAMAEDAAPASPLSFNVGVTSDYIFRGISQTHGDAAVSAGVDYAFSNGFYLGAWASTISWVKDYTGKGTTEVDLYGGYKGSISPDLGYDLGLITYNYPDRGSAFASGSATPTTQEIYAALAYQDFSVKYSYAISDYFVGWRTLSGGKTNGSDYIELNYAHDFGNGWGVSAHTGHQTVKDNAPASYSDWKLGVTKDVGFGVVGLAYSDTNANNTTAGYSWGNSGFVAGSGSTGGFKNVSKGKAVLSFTKAF